jgi:LysR family transcriptional regulator, cyn operon transcriptional activator
LLRETPSLVVGPGHPHAIYSKVLPGKALARAPLVLLNARFVTRSHIDDYCYRLGIQPNVVVDTTSIGTIVDIVRRGRLATMLPDRVDLAHDGVCPVPLDPLLPARTAVLLGRKGAYRAAASRPFE